MVPRFCTGYHQVFFAGDQVTRESRAQDEMQSDEEKEVIPQSADWHAQVCFLQGLYDELPSWLK